MKIYYSPCKTGTDTIITYVDENTLNIDGEDYEFDASSVEFPDIAQQTNHKILEASRKLVEETGHNELAEDGVTEIYVVDVPEHTELFLKVFRGYSESCPWDIGAYQSFGEVI